MAQILKKPIRWEDGFVIPPEEPGLGVELNEEVALAHPWTGDGSASHATIGAGLAAGLNGSSLIKPSGQRRAWPNGHFTGTP